MISLVISAGRGPMEVRTFVRLLAERLAARLDAEVAWTGDVGAPRSATLRTAASATEWLGTHALLATLRGNRTRKRWFVSVTVAADASVRAAPRIAVTTMRSGGPGGQNVNKRATAARATDGVSGISVRASNQRSQARNRALAVRRLGDLLDAVDVAQTRATARERHTEHGRLERGNARFEWRLDGRGRLIEGGTT